MAQKSQPAKQAELAVEKLNARDYFDPHMTTWGKTGIATNDDIHSGNLKDIAEFGFEFKFTCDGWLVFRYVSP